MRCVEPTNVKQKRHPSTLENSVEDRKPQKSWTSVKGQSSPKDSEKGEEEDVKPAVAASETMYNDAEHRAAVIQHPKLQAPTPAHSGAGSLQTSLIVVASILAGTLIQCK